MRCSTPPYSTPCPTQPHHTPPHPCQRRLSPQVALNPTPKPQVLQWARANGCPWDESTCAAAAEQGHGAMMEWILAQQKGGQADDDPTHE